jgi:hypothetical protein
LRHVRDLPRPGLTGAHGVIIPAVHGADLMLDHEIVDAVARVLLTDAANPLHGCARRLAPQPVRRPRRCSELLL